MLLSLEPMTRRLPPQDGLVTRIFPKLAAMLAIDQAAELAQQHKLAPTVESEIAEDAVQRAAAQEACNLVWNEDGRRYELQHPAIAKALVNSPGGTEHPMVLHINVSTHALSSSASTAGARGDPPIILVTNPNRASPAAFQPTTPRTSTMPVEDHDEPLASLDFSNMTLKISAAPTANLIPSLYAIDALISAILTVAVADEATNPVMASMDLTSLRPPPIPRAPSIAASVATTTHTKLYAGSLVATLAEREDAEQEAKLMAQLQSKDQKWKQKGSKGKQKGKKKQPKQIVVEELDLEKYGYYEGGRRDGQKIPEATRTALQFMFWFLRFVVWVLTVGVQLLAWVLVGLTRAITSEKF